MTAVDEARTNPGPTMMDEEHGPSAPSPPASPTVAAVGDDGSADNACAEESSSNDAQQEQQHVHATNELHHDPTATSHDAENSGKAAGDLEAKNPFDDDGAAGVSSPDPDTEAGESAHNNEKEDEDERSPSPPPRPSQARHTVITNQKHVDGENTSKAAGSDPTPQAPPPPQQASPFPKFEPYRPQSDAAVADELDDDEWAAFEDGFQDEDSLGMPGLGVAGNASAAAATAGNAKPPLMPPAKTTAAPAPAPAPSSTPGAPSVLTLEDIEICQRLDEEFDRALEEREIGWTARYNSVRQCACLSLTFMGIYLVLGTWYFFRHTDWALNDTLLFTIYTITTIGLGNHDIPNTAGVQTFIIFFIFVGIATLTIMVAQVYQCVVLETTRAQYSRDRAELSRHRQQSSHLGGGTAGAGSRVSSAHGGSADEPWAVDFDTVAEHTGSCGERILHNLDRTKHFLRNTELGRGVSVLLPFVGLILIGAAVVGPIEGWTVIESIYFSVVALTTTGYGDYFPTKNASVWFCIFWLPFSVGFMSLYLGGVAHFYIQLSNSNIQRLERQMRRRIRKAKEWAEKERREASARVEAANAAIKKKQMQALEADSGGDDSGSGGADDDAVKASVSPPRKPKNRDDFFQTLPSGDMFDEDDEDEVSASVGVMGKQNLRSESRGESFGAKRRERIIGDASRSEEMQNGGGAGSDADGDLEGGTSRPRGTTMSTMRDIIDTVHGHISSHGAGATPFSGGTLASIVSGNVQVKVAPESDLMRKKVSERKPSFALRVLTQERLAEIIAIEVAGYQTSVNIQETTMSLTIDRLNPVLDKWTIPRRARKAFRTVAFESLYFVGERGLIIRGADALYDLTPFEFHRLFAPLLAAMGDADTMEGWLDNTNVLAEVDLKKNYGLMNVSPVKRPAFSERLAAVQERQHHNVVRDASTKLKKATFRRKVPGNALSK